MKYSGMVRKIDELGRIVIPKEIRKNVNIHDGEELEFIIENDAIILKKNKGIFNNYNLLNKICLLFNKIYNVDIVFSNLDKTIISNNVKLININLNNELKYLINNRESINKYGSYLINNQYYLISPLIIDGNCYGLLILISNQKIENELINSFNLIYNVLVSMYDIS